MGNYSELKDLINNPTSHGLPAWDNGDNEIEGEMMKSYLLAIVNSLSSGGYLFAGVAKLTPTQTDPGTPDQNVFYIATEPGTYTNFVGAGGSLVVADGEVAIFKFNGTWSKEVTGAATAAQVAELGQKFKDVENNDITTIEDKIDIYTNDGEHLIEIKGQVEGGAEKEEIVLEEDNGEKITSIKKKNPQRKMDGVDFVGKSGDILLQLVDGFIPNPKSLVSRVFYVSKSGTEKCTSLSRALMDAVQYMDSIVFVGVGEYNLITEFEEIFGNDFFENFQNVEYSHGDYHHGLYLKNRVKVIFATGAKVAFPYEGDNAGVNRQFSPFNAGEFGFTLINAYVECKNCRYVVHDEMGPYLLPYRNIYEHCHFKGDNTDNTHWGGPAMWCIGGGLGRSGDVVLKDCTFENAEGIAAYTLVSYHNAQNINDAQSKITMTGCLFGNGGTFRIAAIGNSTKMTVAQLTNNKLGREIVCEREQAGSTTPFNVSYVEWNNIIN